MDIGTASHEQTLRLLPNLSEVSRARDFLREVAAHAGFTAERIFDIAVATSEACANAIEHTGAQEEVIVQTGLFRDRLEVHVLAPGEFRLPTTDAERRHRGLGLPLMATLADHLALYSRAEGGTLVTLTFYLSPDRVVSSPLPLPQNQLELLEENVLLAAILASAPLGIFVVDPDLCVRWANDASRAYLDDRWADTDPLGQHLEQMLPPPGRARFLERLREVSRSGRSYINEETPFHGLERGTTFWSVRMLPLPGERRRPPYDVLVLVSDITEAVLIRRALMGERNQLHSVLASLAEGVIIADAEGTILLMNDQMLRLQGLRSRDELRGSLRENADWELSTLEGSVLAMEDWPLARAIRGESFADLRLRVRSPRLSLPAVWSYAGAPVPAGEGGPRLAVLTVRDITEAIGAEEALREANERFETVLESMNDGFALFDADWVIVYMNERLAQQVARRRADLLGKVVWDVFPGDAGESRFYEEAHAAVRDQHPRSFLDRLSPVDAYLDVRLVPFRGGLAVLTRDVTSEVTAGQERERLLASLQEELVRATLLQEVTQAATGEPDLVQAAQRVLQALSRGLGVVVGAVRVLDPAGRNLRLVASVGLSAEEREAVLELPIEVPDSPASLALHLGSPVTHPNELVATERPIALGRTPSEQARAVTIPLEHRGEMLGVLDLGFQGRRPFAPVELDVVHTVSHIVAQAVAQSRLLEIEQRARQEEEQRTRLTDSLSAITSGITSTLDPESILRRAVLEGAAAIGAEASAIATREDETWTLRYVPGLDRGADEAFSADQRIPFADLAGGRSEVVAIHDTANDQRVDAALMAGHRIAALLLAPLVARGEVVAALVFVEREGPRRYRPWEREFASRLALAVSLALETARLFHTQKEIADVLQEALLAVPQSIPGLEVQHFYRSATQAARVGGDFYDLFLLEEGRVAALIGDVSGHGVTASSQAAYVRDTVKAYLYQGLPLDRVLDLANQAVLRREGTGFVTLFAAVLDIQSGAISYSSAGHPPPVVRRKSGEAVQLQLSSPPLGTFADAAYPVGLERLEEDDLLVLFTDGLIEARQGGALFGEAGLLRVLGEGGDDLPALGRRLMREVLAYGGGRLTDDVALVLLAFHPSRLVSLSPAEVPAG